MQRTGISRALNAALAALIGLALAAPAAPAFAESFIQIKGSDTEVNLVQRLAEVYMTRRKGVAFAVTGGGSGTGIAALINGKADIANSSRAIKDKEIEQARSRGVEPVALVIAMDGLSVIVNAGNPLDDLTVDQIARIFKGEITNWHQVGGPDLPISLYGRQSNSGTFVFFRDHILKGDYSPHMKHMNGNAQIVEGVRSDRGGIGYVGVGYIKDEEGRVAEGLKPLKVREKAGSPAVSPLDVEAVKSGAYPIARPLFQYTNGKPQGPVADFIKFEVGEAGQQLAQEMGFYPITVKYAEQNEKSLSSKTASSP